MDRDEWKDGWIDGRKEGWMDGRKEKWKDRMRGKDIKQRGKEV